MNLRLTLISLTTAAFLTGCNMQVTVTTEEATTEDSTTVTAQIDADTTEIENALEDPNLRDQVEEQIGGTDETTDTASNDTENSDTTTGTNTDVVDNSNDTSSEEAAPLFSWFRPDTRNNGETLYSYEIGGFKVKVTKLGDTEATIVDLDMNSFPSDVYFYDLEGFAAGQYEVSIATYDLDGLTSLFSEPEVVEVI